MGQIIMFHFKRAICSETAIEEGQEIWPDIDTNNPCKRLLVSFSSYGW